MKTRADVRNRAASGWWTRRRSRVWLRRRRWPPPWKALLFSMTAFIFSSRSAAASSRPFMTFLSTRSHSAAARGHAAQRGPLTAAPCFALFPFATQPDTWRSMQSPLHLTHSTSLICSNVTTLITQNKGIVNHIAPLKWIEMTGIRSGGKENTPPFFFFKLLLLLLSPFYFLHAFTNYSKRCLSHDSKWENSTKKQFYNPKKLQFR